MRIHVITAYSQGLALECLRRAAVADRFGVHTLVDDPADADAVLFVENARFEDPFYERLLRHPLARAFAGRVFMYNECDAPYCALPGLYVSMPRRRFDPTRQVPFGYLYVVNELITEDDPRTSEPDILYSFVGAATHRVRRRIFELADARGCIVETSEFSIWDEADPAELQERKRNYADIMRRSMFVLCPRGGGTSSYRLFEAMQAGRVPVVISDEWVEPSGPHWSEFLIRVRQTEVRTIPVLIRSLESEWEERGKAARAAWEQWFAPNVVFHHAAESVARLMNEAQRVGQASSWLPDRELIRLRFALAVKERVQNVRRIARRVRAAVRGAVRTSASDVSG